MEQIAFGRFPDKPQIGDADEYNARLQKFFMEYDDDKHLEERIDAVRRKLRLNQRFNKAMEEENENTAKEGLTAVRTLAKEANKLRRLLAQSMQREKAVVQSATDTHREFQLALSDKEARQALPWLEDKVHEQTNKLNAVKYELKLEQEKLQQVEAEVKILEELDENGNTPEEQKLIRQQEKLETQIECSKMKREAAGILRKHYQQQIEILVDDNNKLLPVSKELDKTYLGVKKELERLIIVRDTSARLASSIKTIYKQTREKYNLHDKARRGILAEKRVEMRMDMDRRKSSTQPPVAVKLNLYGHVFGEFELKNQNDKMTLAEKQEEVDYLEDKVNRITSAMRVKHISFCGPRMKSTIQLNELLQDQLESKEEFLSLLQSQNEQLYLIKTHLKFTGNEESMAAAQAEKEATEKLGEIEDKIKTMDKDRNKHKANFQQIKDGILQILGCIGATNDECKQHESLLDLTEFFQLKVLGLIQDVNGLREELIGMEPRRDYSKFLRPPKVPKEHVRLATPPLSDHEGDDDDDGADVLDTSANRVLGREDVKELSSKLTKRARLFGSDGKPLKEDEEEEVKKKKKHK